MHVVYGLITITCLAFPLELRNAPDLEVLSHDSMLSALYMLSQFRLSDVNRQSLIGCGMSTSGIDELRLFR